MQQQMGSGIPISRRHLTTHKKKRKKEQKTRMKKKQMGYGHPNKPQALDKLRKKMKIWKVYENIDKTTKRKQNAKSD